jgi:hypothetical protein
MLAELALIGPFVSIKVPGSDSGTNETREVPLTCLVAAPALTGAENGSDVATGRLAGGKVTHSDKAVRGPNPAGAISICYEAKSRQNSVE